MRAYTLFGWRPCRLRKGLRDVVVRATACGWQRPHPDQGLIDSASPSTLVGMTGNVQVYTTRPQVQRGPQHEWTELR